MSERPPSPGIFSRIPRNVWVFGAYFVMALLFYGPLLSPDAAPVAYDQRSGGYALREFVVEGWKQGEMRWWNPTVEGGIPTVSGLTFELFYPDHILWFFMNIDQAFKWSFILHTALAAFLLFWVLQRVGVSFALALAGGAVVGFGYIPPQAYAGHLAKGIVLTWLPLLLWLVVLGVRQGAWWHHLLWGGILGMLMGVQQLQMVYYAYLAAGLVFLVGLLLFVPFSFKDWGMRALKFAGGVVFSLLIGATQWIPAFFYIRHFTLRQSTGIEHALSWGADVQDVLSLWIPLFSGISIPEPHYWGSNPFRHDVAYLGVLGLAGTMGAMFLMFRRSPHLQSERGKWVILTFFSGLFFLLVSLAGHTPLFYLLYHVLPMFSKFRAHALALGFAQVLFLFAAMLSLEILKTDAEIRRWKGWRIAGGILLALGGLGVISPGGLAGVLQVIFHLTPEKASALLAHIPHLSLALGWVGVVTLLVPGMISSWTWVFPLAVIAELFVITRPFVQPAPALKAELRPLLTLARRLFPDRSEDPHRVLPLFYQTEAFNWSYAGLQTASGGFPFASRYYLQLIGAQGFVLSPGSFGNVYQNPHLLSVMDVDRVIMPLLPDTATLRTQFGKHPAFPMLMSIKMFQERLRREMDLSLQRQPFGVFSPYEPARRVRWYPFAVALPDRDTEAVFSLVLAGRSVLDTLYVSADTLLAGPPSKAGQVILESYRPGKVEVRVQSDGGWVFLAENFTDQWRVRVDDGPWVPVVRAMHAFMAYPVPPGDHRVTFQYIPSREKKGLILSLVALILGVVVSGLSWKAERPSP